MAPEKKDDDYGDNGGDDDRDDDRGVSEDVLAVVGVDDELRAGPRAQVLGREAVLGSRGPRGVVRSDADRVSVT